METVKIVNVKCGGCAKTIISELEKIGVTDISVDITSGNLSFEGEKEMVLQKLASLGYPEAGTKEAESLLKKAKSFVSCAVGKMK